MAHETVTMERTQAIEELLTEDSQSLMNVYTSKTTETLNLFYPSRDGKLVYQNTGFEVLLCYLLQNLDKNMQKTKLMDFNRPQPEILFVPSRSDDSTLENKNDLTSSLKHAPYPVILDSHVTGAHHRIWRGHGELENLDNSLDIKCRDAFGVFPTLAQLGTIMPQETADTFQTRSKNGIFPSNIVNEVLSSPFYELLSPISSNNEDKEYLFYEAEMIIFKALPLSFRHAYLHVNVFCCLYFQNEFPELTKVLLHALFWTYEKHVMTCTEENLTTEDINKSLIGFISENHVKNYFLPSQSMLDASCEYQQDNIVSLQGEFKKVQQERLDSKELSSEFCFDIPDDAAKASGAFINFMQDRISCTLKLNILRLRKQLCDAGKDTDKLEDWLECNPDRVNDECHIILHQSVQSWLVSMTTAKNSKQSSCKSTHEPTLPLCASAWKVTEASLAFRRKDYQQAFDLVAPILSAVSEYETHDATRKKERCGTASCRPLVWLANRADGHLSELASTTLTDPDFLPNSFALQALSFFIVSGPEVNVHADFITNEEVRLAASPLAGEFVNNSTGVFSLPVVAACIGALSLWQMACKSSKGPDSRDQTDQALQLLCLAEQMVTHLAAEPWDANEKRFCAHQNMLGRCYLQMGYLKQAEDAFTRSYRAFPRPLTAAETLRKRAQRQRQREEAGSSKRILLAAALCATLAIALGFFRFYAK